MTAKSNIPFQQTSFKSKGHAWQKYEHNLTLQVMGIQEKPEIR
jgi:hypothetical protein